jgi:hypothetical protein
MRWAGHLAGMGDRRGAYGFVVGPDGKKLLGRYGRLWEDNIKNYFQGVCWRIIVLIRDRWWAHVNVVMNLRVA